MPYIQNGYIDQLCQIPFHLWNCCHSKNINMQQQVCLTCLMRNKAYTRLHDPDYTTQKRFKMQAVWKTSINCSLIRQHLCHHKGRSLTICAMICSLGVDTVLPHAQDIVRVNTFACSAMTRQKSEYCLTPTFSTAAAVSWSYIDISNCFITYRLDTVKKTDYLWRGHFSAY